MTPRRPEAPSGRLSGGYSLGGQCATSLQPPSPRGLSPTESTRWPLRPSCAPGPTAPPAPGPTAPPAFASLFPPGLHAIYGECRRLYPDQPNPLQVTAIVKYWYALGRWETDRRGLGR
ncbi:hypothetical protein P7K49_024361 [Saguinus oedipus]|uniref:Uncharacterized protein n=1 Tax=Saguinus oedipus TaxID=9490 RepID=A0ABQ9UQ49_SAGOE|nr:hypothetical protein P7K49_024361 [Saguinus oedipus]